MQNQKWQNNTNPRPCWASISEKWSGNICFIQKVRRNLFVNQKAVIYSETKELYSRANPIYHTYYEYSLLFIGVVRTRKIGVVKNLSNGMTAVRFDAETKVNF